MKTPPSPAPAAPDAEKPRTVCVYRGMQIQDCRDRIQVVTDGTWPAGARAGLRVEGFRKRSDTTWDAPSSPMSIAAARAIGNIFFGEEQP